jgi:hypothetical protein
MPYFMDAEKITLAGLKARIERTDLVPSRASLLDGMEKNFKALAGQGILTLAHLRTALKNAQRLESTAKKTGVDSKYLILLRREIEGYFPKPSPLKAFSWLPKSEIAKLEKTGIKETASLYEAAGNAGDRAELVKKTRINADTLDTIFRCADLVRVQWVSPTTARMLVETGCDSASRLAAADPEKLCAALDRINTGGKYFRGKIGLRDVKRLIRAAGYVPKG